jgi:meso-butanediol dehydrogenase / (S,S)-butanediol dehydrogenase / diacetyl reductase
VVVADRRVEPAEKLAADLRQQGWPAKAIAVDVSKSEQVKAMIDATLAEFGRLDVLVNNAGYGTFGTVVDTDEQEWDHLMATNVRGVFLCCKYAIPAMRANGGGVIVNVASVVAAVGIRSRAPYVASKGAVAALTRAIALDHMAEGIRCNAVAPGTIDTPYYDEVVKRAPDAAAFRNGLEARQPLGRLGTPEEIADGILFLACDESRFATGSILTIDGGMTAQ